MTSKKHNFEELDAPASAAEKLNISVATLRKYSLIVEKVTGNPDYYERTKQKARLYHQKDIDDIKAFHSLAKTKGLTLKEAARQIYAVSDKTEDKDAEDQNRNQLMDPRQVAKLLGALQQTIASQNTAITNLQKQVDRIEKQNRELLKKQEKTQSKDMEVAPEIEALPDISGIVSKNQPRSTKSREEKRQEVQADSQKSKEEIHDEILSKARENAQKRQAKENVHRTLADMQLPSEKKHWWQRFLNY